MPRPTAARVLGKRGYRKLHDRLGGSARGVRFVLFTYTDVDDYTANEIVPQYTTPDANVIVRDKPDKALGQSFGGTIQADEKIFTVLADSIVERLPLATLDHRAKAFIAQHTGQTRGAIEYGEAPESILYTIKEVEEADALGGCIPQYHLLAKANVAPAVTDFQA
jgi:cytochrome oxidase Cu insertion factor (SCO1/SenC/PrrC family)